MGNCIPEISADTLFIYDRLIKAKVGEEVTYSELEGIIGRRLKNGMLTTARRKALNDDHIVFGTLRKVGLKRLDDNTIVTNAAATFLHIQRASKRERSRLASVHFESLPQDLQIKHSASAAVLVMIHSAVAPKQIKALESKAAKNMLKLSMIQTIDAIRESEGGL